MGKILKKYKKLLSIPILSVLMMFSFINDVSAASKESLSWSVVIDNTANQLNGYVIEDSGTKALEITTAKTGTNCSYVKVEIGGSVATIKPGNSSCKVYNSSSSRETLAWTFPPVKEIKWGGQDKTQAEAINDTLVTSFNTAISKIVNGNDLSFGNKQAFPLLLASIANNAQNAANSDGWKTGTGTIKNASNNEQTFKYYMKKATKDEIEKAGYSLEATGPSMGWNEKSFIKLSVRDDYKDAIILPYRFPKGYAAGQNLGGMLVTESGETTSYAPEYLSWSHMAYQASNTYLAEHIDASNAGDLFGNSATGSDVESWLEKTVSSMRSAVGIYTIEDLSLNRGTRGVTYYKGIMPNTWFTGVSLVYWFFQIIAIFVMGSSFIKLMIEKNVSVINPGKRVEIMDGLMNLFYSVIMMIMFIPFFTLLATVNEVFVEAMAAMVPVGSTIGDTMINGMLVGIIINIVFFFIMCKINITYIIRAITIGILYATAPLFISMYSFGEGGKQRFETWMKELIVNIFLQSFNAIMTVIFIMTFKYSTARVIEQIALTLSYVALSDYFKNTLLDAGSGNDGIDDKATGVIGSAFGTAAAGVIGGTIFALGGNPKINNKAQQKGAVENANLNNLNNLNNGMNIDNNGMNNLNTAGVVADKGDISNSKQINNKKFDMSSFKKSFKDGDGIRGAIDKATLPKNPGLRKGIAVAEALKNTVVNGAGMLGLSAISMGMEAIDAKSFEVNRRLGQVSGNLMGILPGAYNEFGRIDDVLEEYRAQELEMEKLKNEEVVVKASEMKKNGVDAAYSTKMANDNKSVKPDDNIFEDGELINVFEFGEDINLTPEEMDTYVAQRKEIYTQNGGNAENYKYSWGKNKEGHLSFIESGLENHKYETQKFTDNKGNVLYDVKTTKGNPIITPKTE